MFEKYILRCAGAALHAVKDDDVGAGLDGKRYVIAGTGGADLHVYWLFPVGDLAKLKYLDRQIVGPGPVGVPAGATLVDDLRQGAHAGDALGDFLAQQHSAAAGLGPLSDDDLARISPAQIVRVHPIA